MERTWVVEAGPTHSSTLRFTGGGGQKQRQRFQYVLVIVEGIVVDSRPHMQLGVGTSEVLANKEESDNRQ